MRKNLAAALLLLACACGPAWAQTSGMITTTTAAGTVALDNMVNQWAVPLLRAPQSTPSQTWNVYGDGKIQATDFPGINNGWVGLTADTLTIGDEWDNAGMQFVYSNGNLQSELNLQYVVPTADGTSIMFSATPGPAWTIGVPPGNYLPNIPVAMFSPQNDSIQPSQNDPYQETGSWEYWGQLLQKPGPVIGMPLAVGIGPNYVGDASGWGSTGNIMNVDGNKEWMISVGLTYPGGPTLTQAAAAGLALYDANAPMDMNWANAFGFAVYGTTFGNGTSPNGPYDPSGMTVERSTIIIRPGWEMTGGWYPWGASAPGQVSTWTTDFPAAFRRCVEVFRSQAAYAAQAGQTVPIKVIVDFNPNGDFAVPGSINLDSFYPGDDVVDIVSVDNYDLAQYEGGVDANNNPLLSSTQRFTQYILPNLQAIDAFAQEHNKQVGISEWGAGEFGDNPDFVNGIAAWAQSAKSIVGILGYWSGGSGSGYNSDIELYPNQKAAFIANFGS